MSSSIKWLWVYSVGFRIKLVFCILLSIGGVCLSLLFVESTRTFINNAVEGKNLTIILTVGLIGLKAAQLVCEQGEIYLRTLTKSELENRLELKMFCALGNSKIQAEHKFHSGDEIYRLSGDVGIVAECMAFTFPILVYSVVQLVATWGYLMAVQPMLTVIIGLIAPIIITVGYYYTRLLVPVSRRVRYEGSKVNEYIQEHLQHHELITVMGKNRYVQAKAESLQRVFLKALKSKIRLTVGADTLTEIGFATSYLAVFIWGINGIGNNTISYGEFLVFIQLVGQLQRPVFIFKDQYPSWVSSFASVERLMEITSLPKEKDEDSLLLQGTLGVRFSNVAFRYSQNQKWVFKNFNYDFKPGTITAILGETGAGKSTLIKMALAILSPEHGKIEIYSDIQDAPVYIVSPRTRPNYVYVPQGNTLISGTIKYNLLLGNLNASEDQMKDALHLASADFVLDDFPNGLDTVIGERGLGISEGQAQRIAIARGLLRDGGLLLLDEPTSALDQNTEKLFLDRLVKNSKDKTIIIISHKKEIRRYVSNIITIHRFQTNETFNKEQVRNQNRINNERVY